MAIAEATQTTSLIAQDEVKSLKESKEDSQSEIKRKVAIYSSLESYASSALEGSHHHGLGSVDSSDDDNEGVLGADDPDSSDQTDPDAQDQGGSDDDHAPPANALLAILLAGGEVSEKSNDLMKSLGVMSSNITQLTTDATEQGAQWLKDFYDYGTVDSGFGNLKWGKKPATVKIQFDAATQTFHVNITYGDGHTKSQDVSLMSVVQKGGITTQNIVGLVDEKVANFYDSDPELLSLDAVNQLKLMSGDSVTFYNEDPDAPDGYIPGGIALAQGGADGDLSKYTSMYQGIQQAVSAENTKMQAVSSVPSSMMETITQAVNTAQGSDNTMLQAVKSSGSLVAGWAGR